MPPYVQAIPIRFRDIDALDHVNHAVVLTYCETVRCDWFAREFGIPSMAELPFILASAHVEYKAPIPKEASLEVVMAVPRIGTKSWDLSYALRDGKTGQLYAEATTVQVAYDYKAGKSMVIEPAMRARLERLAA